MRQRQPIMNNKESEHHRRQPVQRLFQSCGQVHDHLSNSYFSRIRSRGVDAWRRSDAASDASSSTLKLMYKYEGSKKGRGEVKFKAIGLMAFHSLPPICSSLHPVHPFPVSGGEDRRSPLLTGVISFSLMIRSVIACGQVLQVSTYK